MYEEGLDGLPVVTGLRMTKAGKEELVTADAYVAALDVPGAKKLIPQVRSNFGSPPWPRLRVSPSVLCLDADAADRFCRTQLLQFLVLQKSKA